MHKGACGTESNGARLRASRGSCQRTFAQQSQNHQNEWQGTRSTSTVARKETMLMQYYQMDCRTSSLSFHFSFYHDARCFPLKAELSIVQQESTCLAVQSPASSGRRWNDNAAGWCPGESLPVFCPLDGPMVWCSWTQLPTFQLLNNKCPSAPYFGSLIANVRGKRECVCLPVCCCHFTLPRGLWQYALLFLPLLSS